MRKIFSFVAAIVVLLLFFVPACKKSSYLTATVISNLDSNDVFKDSTYSMEFLNNIYTKAGFAADPKRFNGGSFAAGLDAASDEAEGPNASSSNGFTMFATGTVNPSIVPSDVWANGYSMIRAANQFLAHLYKIPFNAALKVETKAEVRFLRAWYYFIMVEHYGGVPLIGDSVFTTSTPLHITRRSFRACVDYILAECDSAFANLPLTQSGANYGRASGGTCLALKSRGPL